MTDHTLDRYDEVPYPNLSFHQTHPDRLATLATLIGVTPVPVSACRVLELGCASGWNLIPMAYGLPESEFVGIDLSQRQIAAGVAAVEALGLQNVRLSAMDILDIGQDFGQFDYIIVHGIYSWVPQPVREGIMRICKQNLSPNGIAYISYNTYPGWAAPSAIRQGMTYHTRGITDPRRRAAHGRAYIELLTRSKLNLNPPYDFMLQAYGAFFGRELDRMGDGAESYLLHDLLEDNNVPLYFHQFIEHAEQYGLQYLTEAEFSTVFAGNLPEYVRTELTRLSSSIVDLEQYMDLLRNRMFRMTLLCHAEVPISRSIRPDRLLKLYADSGGSLPDTTPDPHAVVMEQFRGAGNLAFSTDHPVVRAGFRYLIESKPEPVAFSDLLSVAQERSGFQTSDPALCAQYAHAMAASLLKAYASGSSLVNLYTYAPEICLNPGDSPLASLVARVQARDEAMVTNLRHERVLVDEGNRALLQFLDGTNSREELRARLGEILANVKTDSAQRNLDEILERSLRTLAHRALMIG